MRAVREEATTGDAPVPLDRVIAIAQFRASLRLFLRHSDRIASRHGLTPQRHLMLLMIKGGPDGSERLSVGELAERLQSSPNATTELVDRAERAGLVRRQRSGADGRVVHLRLTDEGDRRLASVLAELTYDRHELEDALESLIRASEPV
jgi:DNA-binding MarR family transcriptional regulator